MARKPKAARGAATEPEMPVPSRRKRASSTAVSSPEEQALPSGDLAEESLLLDDPEPPPERRRPGPKPKPKPEAASLPPPEQDAGKRGRKPRQTAPDPEPQIAEDHADNGALLLDDSPDGAEPAPPPASAEQPEATKPAAHWDQSTGTVTFDWPAIEETAAQAGPNQVMAKLLVAARAEGANSRWPL